MTDQRTPVRPTPPGRIATTVGPEWVGGILAVVVVVIAGLIALPSLGGSAPPVATPDPAASVEPSGAGASAATPSGGPTPAPWSSTASALIDVDAQLIGLRDDLAAMLDPRPDRADGIARTLRTMNGPLTFAIDAIDRLETAGLPADLVTALRTAHQGALDASIEALRASVSNVTAYVRGGRAVVEALTTLEDLRVSLAEASGLPAPAP
jgi:hypothetical protein